MRLVDSTLCLILLSSSASGAEVFRWLDAQGRAHYSDRPAAGAARLPIQAPPLALRRVKKVYDGDTVELTDGEKVRLLGINTPEVAHFGKDGEPGGDQARRWLAERLDGKPVRLEQDAEMRDRYGRLLAHVFTDGGEHINRALVAAGMAFVEIYPPNLKYAHELLEVQSQAERAKRGVWGMPEYAPRPVESLASTSVGGWRRISGTPLSLSEDRHHRRLQFAGGFEVRVPRESWSFFPALESFVGRPLELRGWVTPRAGNYRMTVRHPSAIAFR